MCRPLFQAPHLHVHVHVQFVMLFLNSNLYPSALIEYTHVHVCVEDSQGFSGIKNLVDPLVLVPNLYLYVHVQVHVYVQCTCIWKCLDRSRFI